MSPKHDKKRRPRILPRPSREIYQGLFFDNLRFLGLAIGYNLQHIDAVAVSGHVYGHDFTVSLTIEYLLTGHVEDLHGRIQIQVGNVDVAGSRVRIHNNVDTANFSRFRNFSHDIHRSVRYG